MLDQKDGELRQLLEKFFLNADYLEQYKTAFIHRSYLQMDKNIRQNERLEFLGDAVLELVITDYLYKNLDLPESILTLIRAKIVCEKTLSKISRKLNFGQLLFLGKGEELNGGRDKDSILADTVEAFIGDVYKLEGYEKARIFILEIFKEHIQSILNKKNYLHVKTKLQEISQHKYKKLPEYIVLEEKIEEKIKWFTMKLIVGENEFGPITETSKKKAENELAILALEFYQDTGNNNV